MAKDYSNVAGVVRSVSNTVDDVATRIGQEVAAAAGDHGDVFLAASQQEAE